MTEIILVKEGIKPTLYYRHICTNCNTTYDIINTITAFKCPECQNDEICVQNQNMLIKKYFKNESDIPSKSLSKKKFNKK